MNSDTETFLDSLYSSTAVKKKRIKVDSSSVTAAPTHPMMRKVPDCRAYPVNIDEALITLGMRGSPTESRVNIDRVVALDNFNAGKVKRKKKTAKACVKGARTVEGIEAAVVDQLHTLWLQYMQETSEFPCELLGARIKVVESVNQFNVGIEGVVVREGVNALQVWSKGRLLVLPRDVCKFEVGWQDKRWVLDNRSTVRNL